MDGTSQRLRYIRELVGKRLSGNKVMQKFTAAYASRKAIVYLRSGEC